MKMTVKFKLILLLSVPIILFVATSFTLLKQNKSDVDGMTHSMLDTAYLANDLIVQADRDMYQALRDYDLLRLAPLQKEQYDQFLADFKENVQQVSDRIGQAKGIFADNDMLSAPDPATNTTAEQAFADHQKGFEVWSKQATENVDSHAKSDEQSEIALAQKFDESRHGLDVLNSVLDIYSKKIADDHKAKNRSMSRTLYIVLGIEWILILTFGILLLRYLSRSLSSVISKTKLVASGNLQAIPERKYRRDELGELHGAVDTMIAKMRGLIGRINDNTHTVSASSVELSAGAQESAAASTHVAENIQEVNSLIETQQTIAEESSRAVEEMAVGVQRIAENTTAIADYATLASEQVDLGNGRVKDLKQQMQSISEALGALSRIVGQLTDKSEKITQVTDNITGFANQTNILSFNASIEAARAGEHGKGFAVVAQEIRKLAASSIESAESISELIAETLTAIASASQYMETTLSQAKQGDRVMVEVEQDFSAIRQAVKQVAAQVHETSAITEEMSASSEEVAASMEHSANSAREVAGKAQTVAAATEEQLALAENISQASAQLQGIVKDLKESVSQFRL